MTLRRTISVISTFTLLLAGIAVAFNGTGHPRQADAAGTLPSGWPSTLQLGIADTPGGAAAMKAVAPFGFRYQYLAGGVNTGNGWANWNSNGAFATYYIQDSVANNITPVFTYYMIRQLTPAPPWARASGIFANLQNTSTMSAYWNDLKLFFQKAGAFPNNLVVLQVEPDMWGYVQQPASGDNATSVSASVGSSGLTRALWPAQQHERLREGGREAARPLRPEREARLPPELLGHGHRPALQQALATPRSTSWRRALALLQLARCELRRQLRRVQRPRLRLLPVPVRQPELLVDRRRLRPQRALPLRLLPLPQASAS